MKKILVLLLILIFVCGCSQLNKENIIKKCISVCKTKSQQEKDIGICASENLESGWVCDIAHNPRQGIDDLPQNQCQNYRNEKAYHFVEVDPDCNLIRSF